ncbi:MAG: type II secretion system protein [Deltaproteobacteria bacterium]|nr:type II secretion system protein [Deltaproteobacteria bacterium]
MRFPDYKPAAGRIAGRTAAGFTLMEVMAALIVMSIVLTTIMQLFSGGLKNVVLASEYARAVDAADEYTAKILQSPIEQGPNVAEDEKDGFYYRMEVAPWEGFDTDAGLVPYLTVYQITVTVSWGAKNDLRQVKVVTLKNVLQASEVMTR